MAVTLARQRITASRGRGRNPKQLMEKFVIEGGVPLSGTLTPAGNKNAALPILAACLLTQDEVIVSNVPRIRDVDAMLTSSARSACRSVGVGKTKSLYAPSTSTTWRSTGIWPR